jgi:serine protease AprX
LGYDLADLGSLSSVTRLVGAQAAWARAYTGAGVDVAVIDTGVAAVAGLDGAGKVATGPDLSLDAAEGAPVGVDAFGHGTFMASLNRSTDIFGHPYAAARSNATAWTGGKWNGSRWTGDDWQGSRWTSITWDSTDWTGSRWT